MARFRHTGARLKQLQDESVKRNTKMLFEMAERELGRSLTPEEMENIAQQAADTFGDLPVYGGE